MPTIYKEGQNNDNSNEYKELEANTNVKSDKLSVEDFMKLSYSERKKRISKAKQVAKYLNTQGQNVDYLSLI